MSAKLFPMECGVCWRVYDPEAGDPTRDVSPGTSFGELPGDWACPECGTPKSKFLPLEAGNVDSATKLRQALERIGDARLRGLPVYNDRLQIATLGFSPSDPIHLGVVVTPWAMNAVILSSDEYPLGGAKVGQTVQVSLPSGQYPFVVQHVDGFGPIAACSLFSTMTDFVDQDAARTCASAALSELVSSPEDIA